MKKVATYKNKSAEENMLYRFFKLVRILAFIVLTTLSLLMLVISYFSDLKESKRSYDMTLEKSKQVTLFDIEKAKEAGYSEEEIDKYIEMKKVYDDAYLAESRRIYYKDIKFTFIVPLIFAIVGTFIIEGFWMGIMYVLGVKNYPIFFDYFTGK